MNRGDVWHIKHLVNAHEYLRLPYVDLRGSFDGDLEKIKVAPIQLLWDEFVLQPWNEFVSTVVRSGDRVAIGVSTPRWATAFTGWIDLKLNESGNTLMGVEGISAALAEHPEHNDVINHMLNVIIRSLLLLSTTDSHLVEERRAPTPRDVKSAAKGMHHCREDLPRIILLSPQQARERGQPTGEQHASPRVHLRRGHWMTLKHERYGAKVGTKVWRKPAWVGEREWKYRGTMYRVVDPEVNHG